MKSTHTGNGLHREGIPLAHRPAAEESTKRIVVVGRKLMSIVEDGPCQLVSRTGEGMELLFPNQVNTRSCFGPLKGLADTRAGNLSQGSKRVCKLLGEGVLGRQTGRRRAARDGDFGDWRMGVAETSGAELR
jgi:hypothetical protein